MLCTTFYRVWKSRPCLWCYLRRWENRAGFSSSVKNRCSNISSPLVYFQMSILICHWSFSYGSIFHWLIVCATDKRQLEWLTNFFLIVVSLLGCSIGAGLLGFYQLHLLSFISPEFFIIPLVLLGNAQKKIVIVNSLVKGWVPLQAEKPEMIRKSRNLVRGWYWSTFSTVWWFTSNFLWFVLRQKTEIRRWFLFSL